MIVLVINKHRYLINTDSLASENYIQKLIDHYNTNDWYFDEVKAKDVLR